MQMQFRHRGIKFAGLSVCIQFFPHSHPIRSSIHECNEMHIKPPPSAKGSKLGTDSQCASKKTNYEPFPPTCKFGSSKSAVTVECGPPFPFKATAGGRFSDFSFSDRFSVAVTKETGSGLEAGTISPFWIASGFSASGLVFVWALVSVSCGDEMLTEGISVGSDGGLGGSISSSSRPVGMVRRSGRVACMRFTFSDSDSCPDKAWPLGISE